MTQDDIHLLLTGDELMSGDTVDSNSSMIAQSLAAFGHGVAEKVTLGDDRARLVAALQRAAGIFGTEMQCTVWYWLGTALWRSDRLEEAAIALSVAATRCEESKEGASADLREFLDLHPHLRYIATYVGADLGS